MLQIEIVTTKNNPSKQIVKQPKLKARVRNAKNQPKKMRPRMWGRQKK